jgi:hypothetical protein
MVMRGEPVERRNLPFVVRFCRQSKEHSEGLFWSFGLGTERKQFHRAI